MEKVSISEIGEINEGSEILIKGFLVQDGEGHLFLVSQPDVLSCCLGKEGVSKVLLNGIRVDQTPAYAVDVSGMLHREIGQYSLLQPKIHTVETAADVWALSLLLVPFMLFAGWRKFGGNSR